MNTESKGDLPLRKPTDKKGASKPEKVVEAIPGWLQALLAKHKEAPGPLIGLESPEALPEEDEFVMTDSTGPVSAEEEEADVLSALLEQMADEGPPVGQRSASSVEWGAYAPPESDESSPGNELDDLLANLGSDPYQQAPEW